MGPVWLLPFRRPSSCNCVSYPRYVCSSDAGHVAARSPSVPLWSSTDTVLPRIVSTPRWSGWRSADQSRDVLSFIPAAICACETSPSSSRRHMWLTRSRRKTSLSVGRELWKVDHFHWCNYEKSRLSCSEMWRRLYYDEKLCPLVQ